MIDPGCGVDIPGILYSLSWFPNTKFSKVFPSQPEILSYAQRVAQSYGVSRQTVFRTAWKGAKWNEATRTWRISLRNLDTGDEYEHDAKVLISAVGGYTNPKFPNLPGSESFEGPIVHTAQWSKHHDLRDLNVGVIGNGCEYKDILSVKQGDRS